MNKKPVIILIVGTSGSGKTHLTHYLKAKHNIPFLVSYTTRQIRDNETDGIDHHFITPDQIPDQSEMLAYTNFGNYEYFTTKSQIQAPVVSYVVDEGGVRFLREHFKDQYDTYAVYVSASEETRLARGITKERMDRDNTRKELPVTDYQTLLSSDLGTENFEGSIDLMVEQFKECYS